MAAIIFAIAESPRSGYAECAATPSKCTVHVSAPLDARANFDSVGSPTITYLDPRPANPPFALFAPIESVSSPTTNRNAKSRTPSDRSRSPAAIIAAITPLVSHAPRPKRKSSASNASNHGGTVSMCELSTTRGRPPAEAKTLKRESVTACLRQSYPSRVSSSKRNIAAGAFLPGGRRNVDQFSRKGDRIHHGRPLCVTSVVSGGSIRTF